VAVFDLGFAPGMRIRALQEQAWNAVEPDFVLQGVSREQLLATGTGRDARFVNTVTGQLRLSFHSLVVQTPTANILIDTCIGNNKQRPGIPAWHEQQFDYLQQLESLGLHPDEIDYVCCTHLHGDHVGWNTQLRSGVWVPTFPRARYLLARDELRYWEQTFSQDPEHIYAQPWRDSVLPVIEAGLAVPVAADHEIARGLRFAPAPGHTPGNVVLHVSAGRQRAVLSGDVLHHPVQIERPQWASTFDLDPEAAMATRFTLLEMAAETGAVLIAAHFADAAAVSIDAVPAGFSYRVRGG
jgi:glyoxylase-like metal-dependent hydrolase (beta-lactamase superfamily II)